MYEKQLPSGMRLGLKGNQTIIENYPESLGVIGNFEPGWAIVDLSQCSMNRKADSCMGKVRFDDKKPN